MSVKFERCRMPPIMQVGIPLCSSFVMPHDKRLLPALESLEFDL